MSVTDEGKNLFLSWEALVTLCRADGTLQPALLLGRGCRVPDSDGDQRTGSMVAV